MERKEPQHSRYTEFTSIEEATMHKEPWLVAIPSTGKEVGGEAESTENAWQVLSNDSEVESGIDNGVLRYNNQFEGLGGFWLILGLFLPPFGTCTIVQITPQFNIPDCSSSELSLEHLWNSNHSPESLEIYIKLNPLKLTWDCLHISFL